MQPFSAVLASDDDRIPVGWQGGATFTRRDLRSDVAVMARRVAVAGCRRGAVVSGDTYRFVVGFLGVTAAGATAVIPPNAQPGTLADLAPAFDHLVTDLPQAGLPVIGIPRAEGDGIPAVYPADSARIEFFTSGSSGTPKRIEKTLAELEREAAAIDARWPGLPATASAVATVPHQHIYGLAFKVVWPLLSGRPFAAIEHEFWEDLIRDLPPGGVVVSSPAHLSRLGGIEPLAPSRRPRMILSAGAPLPRPAAADCARVFGVPVDEIYGSTETGAVATRRQGGADELWRPLPGVESACAEDGRLRLRARHVGDGSWLTMEDRVEFASEGFSLLGRSDRIVKIEGKRVALPEVERILAASPLVAEAAAVALGDERAVLAAVVVLSDEGRDRLAAVGPFRLGRLLRQHLAPHLEAAGRPRRWRFVPALPVGPMGKRRAVDLTVLFAEPAHD